MTFGTKIQRASFKGVVFFVTSISTKGGQKTATHEFVNSDERAIEDLGKSPRQFRVDATTAGKEQEYIANRDNLIRVLEEGGNGKFVHPYQGTFFVKCTGYTLTENETELGFANFTIQFSSEEETTIQPVTGETQITDIASKKTALLDETIKSIQDGWEIPVTADSIQDAKDKIIDIVNSVNEVSQKFSQQFDNLNDFASVGEAIVDNVVALVSDPFNLATDLDNLFNRLDDLFENPFNQFSAYRSLFGFGSGELDGNPAVPSDPAFTQSTDVSTFFPTDISSKNNTKDLIEREQNRNTLNAFVQVNSYARATQASAEIDFQTVEDISDVQEVLEDQFLQISTLMDRKAQQSKLVASANKESLASDISESDTIILSDDLRKTSRLFFQQQRLTTPKIQTIDTPVEPVAVQTFRIYGALDNASTLLEINSTRDTIFFGGDDTKVLTDA